MADSVYKVIQLPNPVPLAWASPRSIPRTDPQGALECIESNQPAALAFRANAFGMRR